MSVGNSGRHVATDSMRILGVDPGSRATGLGVIDVREGRTACTCALVVRLGTQAFPERLRIIFEEVRAVIECHSPDVLAVEQVFMHRNAAAALKLGQARGAAICAAVTVGMPVHEYAPRAVKQAVVGVGGAGKGQVQHMVQLLLGLDAVPEEDAADALAVALCHTHNASTLARLPGARTGSRRRWR